MILTVLLLVTLAGLIGAVDGTGTQTDTETDSAERSLSGWLYDIWLFRWLIHLIAFAWIIVPGYFLYKHRERTETIETEGLRSEMEWSSTDKFVLVAAIDFGTTFSGYAFSFRATRDDPDLPEKIITNKSWGESLGFHSYKTPTSVLTTTSGKFKAFGYEAEQLYCETMEEDDTQDLLLFRHFKMILHNKQNVKLSTTITSVDGTIRPAIDIFTHAIKYLKDHLLNAIELETGSTPDTNLMRWVITVPSIWSEESKQFMREAAFRAGCIDGKDSRKLIIALEPEAASFFCRKIQTAKYEDETELQFTPGVKYLVLDCGGGTVDITVHQMGLDKVNEIYRASGGPWGGTKIDANFVDLLESLFGKQFLNSFQQDRPRDWLQLLTNFEKIKKAFKPDGLSRINVSLQFSMAQLFAKLNEGKSINKAIKEASVKGVSFRNGTLVLTHDRAKELFNPVVQSIVQHLKSLLHTANLRGIKYILMVGGFSECKVLQHAIKTHFQKGGTKVLIPGEAQLAIIKGAVLFGHRQREIASRISQHSFGIENRSTFVYGIHDAKYKDIIDGRELCGNIFSSFVKRNEPVEFGRTVTQTFRATRMAQTSASIPLFCYEKIPRSPVQYTDAPGMKQLGHVTVELPGHGLDRQVDVIFTFGNTEIQVDAIDRDSGNKAETLVDFLSR